MGYVYKITHKESEKWYIGSHDGHDPNYFGSGLLLKKAVVKYGHEAFTKEILYEGPDFRMEEERILKLLNAANDNMSYNLKNEALGGSFPGEKNGMYGKKLSDKQRKACGNAFRGKTRPDHSKRMAGENNPMYGKCEHAHGIIARSKECAGKTFEEIFGKERAVELKAKLSHSLLGKKHNLKTVKCPYCSTIGAGPNMTRYHFENCKNKSSYGTE